MLIGKGAEVKPVGEMALNMAIAMECSKCLSLLHQRQTSTAAKSLSGDLRDPALDAVVSMHKE